MISVTVDLLPLPPGRPGYEVTIESLVATTRDLVSSQLKVMWDIAQRASPRVKIEGCVK